MKYCGLFICLNYIFYKGSPESRDPLAGRGSLLVYMEYLQVHLVTILIRFPLQPPYYGLLGKLMKREVVRNEPIDL